MNCHCAQNIKLMWKECKRYFKDINNIYNYTTIFFWGVIITAILFCLDFYNIPTVKCITPLRNVPQAIIIVAGIGVFLAIACIVAHLHFFDLFRINTVNILDAFVFITLISVTGYCLLCNLFAISHLPAIDYICYCYCAIGSLFLIVRIFARYKVSVKQIQKKTLFDLEEIYKNTFSIDANMPIFVDEDAVSYDLLDRGQIVYQLLSSVKNCHSTKSFVIGLEGAWGAGKSTIIKNTKRMIAQIPDLFGEYIIVDDFDPWLFGSQEAMLVAMYELLLNKIGIKYNSQKISSMSKELIAAVVENASSGKIIKSSYNIFEGGTNKVDTLKSYISSILNGSNKKIVFIIDNLDRANDENIIFLLKIINLVFDLPNIVYVLCYDRQRMDRILGETHEFEGRFIEKIVQQEISVPAISTENREALYSRCIHNILIAYGVKSEDLAQYDCVVDCICKCVADMRTFKRLVNSAFVTAFSEDEYLYKRDLLAIEVVRFLNYTLYCNIKDNPWYFVSQGFTTSRSMTKNLVLREQKKQEVEDFLQGTVQKHPEYAYLLACMFPKISNLPNLFEYVGGKTVKGHTAAATAQMPTIYDERYFYLYFSYGSNTYLQISSEVKKLIAGINKSSSIDDISKLLNHYPSEHDKAYQKEWGEQFQANLNSVNLCKSAALAEALFKRLHKYDKSQFFAELNAFSRVSYIIACLLSKCSINEFENLACTFSKDISKMQALNGIANDIEKYVKPEIEDAEERAAYIYKEVAKICESVIEGRINLYLTDYHEGNIFVIRNHFVAEQNEVGFKKYIKSCLSEKTVYRMLWDISTASIGTGGYRYYISKDNFDKLFDSEEEVVALLEKVPPKNESEKLVFNVFQSYKNKTERFEDLSNCFLEEQHVIL